jgi:glutathione S-transferase
MLRRMLLYDSGISGNCYKVRLLFAHLGIDYERQDMDVLDRSNRREVLGRLNPALRVPTLVLDDGRSLAESNAIIFHFAEGTQYLPEDSFERAQVLQWLFFEQYSHEPNIAVARFWALFDVSPPSTADYELKMKAGRAALAAMDAHLTDRTYMVGERYTIADIALYAYTHVAPEGGFELEPYPAIRAWIQRVMEQPGHVPITA